MEVVNCPGKSLLVLVNCVIGAGFGAEPEHQSTIKQSTAITVSVCSFDGLPPWVLEGAEAEVARIFRPAAIVMNWLDCNSQVSPSSAELVIRVVPHAFSPASKAALAMAFPSAESTPSAFIFYDRVI